MHQPTNFDVELSEALTALRKVLEAQLNEAPGLTYRDSVEGEIGLVNEWLNSIASGVNILAVANELEAISKAIDAFYPWSNLCGERELAITRVWQCAHTATKATRVNT